MIDYKLINDSIYFYNIKGFSRIETPWLVTEEIDAITRSASKNSYRVESKNKNLIASGEQGFLYLYLKNYLPKGKFQTVTPCFRDDSFDYMHSKYFMKNELINTKEVSYNKLEEIINNALDFYNKYFNNQVQVSKKNNDEYDLEIEGYELGSYGIRKSNFLEWIYGTGCAEPRTSRLIKLYRNGISQK